MILSNCKKGKDQIALAVKKLNSLDSEIKVLSMDTHYVHSNKNTFFLLSRG